MRAEPADGGKKPVSLTYQDRDLLEQQNAFKQKYPGDGWKIPWSEFLIAETTKRKLERARKLKEREIERKKRSSSSSTKAGA